MPNRSDLSRARPIALVALEMGHEVADVIADLIVLVVDRKRSQDPMKVGLPVPLVALHRAAKGDHALRTWLALPCPDLNAKAAHRFFLPRGSHFAFLRAVAAPDVPPLVEPPRHAPGVTERVAVLGVIGNTIGRPRRYSVIAIDPGVVSLFRKQGVRQNPCGCGTGHLLGVVIVLALGSLNDLIRTLSQMQLSAASQHSGGHRDCSKSCCTSKA